MSKGQHPTRRHDDTCFGDGDNCRKAMAGRPLGWKAALCWVKGDLAEHCHSLGFTTWAHTQHPCILCKCQKPDMFKSSDLSPATFPYPLKAFADFDHAVRGCEFSRDFSVDELQELKGAVKYDKSSGGSCGLALCVDG